MSITRSQLQHSGVPVPIPGTLGTSLSLRSHPLRRKPVLVLGSRRELGIDDVASLVFDPVTSTVEDYASRLTSASAGSPFGVLVLDLAMYQALVGKDVAPLDVTLTTTPASFKHRLGAKPVIVLGTMIHGTVRDGAVLVFDPLLSDATSMSLSHTAAAGSALWRVLPITQARYNEIVGKVGAVIEAADLATANTLIDHRLPLKPFLVLGCQKFGDVVDGAQLVYERPASTASQMAVRATAAGADWLLLPIAGRSP